MSAREGPRPDAGPAPRGFVPFASAEVEQSIPARFAKMARAHPGRLAVKAGGRALSYAELDAAANQVAHALLDRFGAAPRPWRCCSSSASPSSCRSWAC